VLNLLLTIALIFHTSILFAQELNKSGPTFGEISALSSDSINIEMRKGDYLRGTIIADHDLQEVLILSPDGQAYKRLNYELTQNQFFQLVAESSGRYRLKLSSGENNLSYRVEVNGFYPLAVQGSEAVKIQSPRIQALQRTLSAGGTTDAFWSEITKEGTPLIEPGRKPNSNLVTFLWRGAKNNVRLFGSPKDKHAYLEQLADSDVWYQTYELPSHTQLSYQLSPDTPALPDSEGKNRIAIKSTAQVDPLNKHPWVIHPQQDRFSTYSTLRLSKAPSLEWLTNQQAAQGKQTTYEFKSETLGNQRKITLYQSAGLEKEKGSPLLFFFDSLAYRSKVPTPLILDNLVAAGKIPPVTAVFVSNPNRKARSTELPCNPKFAKFMADELHPWVIKNTGIEVETKTTLLSGSSYGGLASACVALAYPDKFGLVLSQSGSFWWSPEFRGSPDFTPEWLPQQIAKESTKAVKFYLNAGLFEQGWQPSDILPSNRHMRDVLTAKGYEVIYEEVASGHDYFSWRSNLPQALITLLQPQN